MGCSLLSVLAIEVLPECLKKKRSKQALERLVEGPVYFINILNSYS